MNFTIKNNKTEFDLPDPQNWESIHQWRKIKRELLVKARIKITREQRKQCLQKIKKRTSEILSNMPTGTIGFYWPIKGEFDLHRLVVDTLDQGWQAALPVVKSVGEPLEFHLWKPEMKLVPGVWNIPEPQERCIVTPTVLLVPLVGFDTENYRLGYGGGHYDRTLASLDNQPVTIGIGLDMFRLETIYPQWHDIPMDWIVSVPTLV